MKSLNTDIGAGAFAWLMAALFFFIIGNITEAWQFHAGSLMFLGLIVYRASLYGKARNSRAKKDVMNDTEAYEAQYFRPKPKRSKNSRHRRRRLRKN